MDSGQTLKDARSIAVLAVDGMSPFHLSVPLLVFAEPRAELGVPRFQVRICGMKAGPVRLSSGVAVTADAGLRALRAADVVIVPGWCDVSRPVDEAVAAALRGAHENGATVVGLCLGAFALAQARMLDGRRATTHWNWSADFQARFPRVRMDPDVLYVHDGRLLTSAGTAASLDCCLYLLRQVVGVRLANRVARRLVAAPHRAGGQAQFIDDPVPASPAADRMGTVLSWASKRLHEAHTLDSLAGRAAMSRRNFSRQFQRTTGTSVMQWLLQHRLSAAAGLLEGGTQSIEDIATRVGFGSAVSLRQQFGRHYGVSPQVYRRQFQAPPRSRQPAG